MSGQLRIRTADPSDAAALAVLAANTFRETFGQSSSSEDIEVYLREWFSLERVQDELHAAANTFLLAFMNHAEEPIGYAKLRTGTTEPSVTGPDPVELHRLYVSHHAIGQGVGAALMKASLDAARAAGHRTIWLGVWEHNRRAMSFYEKWGFETVGEHLFRLGSEIDTDLIMVRPVDDGG